MSLLGSNPRRNLGLLVGSLLIGGGFWWLLRAGALPLLPEREAFSSVSWLGVVAFSISWLLTLVLKGLRWSTLLAAIGRVPLRDVLAINFVSQAAVLLMPLRSGEFVRPVMLSRRSSISFLAGMSTSAAERIGDSLFASVMLIVALASSEQRTPLPDRIGELPVPAALVPGLGYSAATVTLLACSGVLAFYYFRAGTRHLLGATLGRLWPKAAEWTTTKLQQLCDGLQFLGSVRYSAAFLGTSALYWASHVVSTWVLFRTTTFPELTFGQAAALLGTLAFGMSIPNAPGFFGVFQVATYASLAVFYAPERIQKDGALPVFLLYVLEVAWVLAMAVLGGWYNRRNSPGQVPANG